MPSHEAEAQVEVQTAIRWTEVRIGELLGPGEQGGDRRSDDFKSHASDLIDKDDAYRFRTMAAHRDIVEDCLEGLGAKLGATAHIPRYSPR